ncbi:MAG TPA: M23 family metallopeptidase [Acidobacteriota bacterium]|nr:M23 family metallopeptidase [Acidobacteriota bacterium]
MEEPKSQGLILTVATTQGEKVRIVPLSFRQLCAFCLILLCILSGVSLLAFHYYRMWLRTEDYTRLQGALDEVRRSEEALRLRAGQLSDQLASLEVTAQKLRILSGFSDDALGGLGGPKVTPDPVVSLSNSDLARHFRTLDSRRVSLQAKLAELTDYYTTREVLLSATPSIMPVRGYPSDSYGGREDPFSGEDDFHPGIDISAPKGAKVVATADGLVVYAGRRLGYGNMVVIQHKFGLSTRYAHLQACTVKSGQRILKGDVVGYVGSTGRVTGTHLHYEVRLRNQPLNPLRFLGEDSAGL